MKRCLGCFKEIPEELEICPYCGYIEGTPAEEAIHLEPGSVLANRYIIGKVVGYGGFGVTYIAWDGKLEQRVAIKEYLPSEFATRMPGQSCITVFNGEKSEQFRDGMNKFIDEARRLAKFQNEDGIVKVFDCIAENDTAYIVMEYLEGETLTEYLRKRKTISEDEAIQMLMPIMESLRNVHASGILHRDIAPDNIFLTTDGQVKLIDFGASRFATTSHSRSLTVIVKPGYSPEEQYRSRGDQGPHTDVYSVAATLYKMITGTTPPDALERRAKVETTKRDNIVEPRKINSEISLKCENAVMNALNVQIEDRTPDISQFIEELNSEEPVKRRYGKIKKIDFYRWPLWLKIAVPALSVCMLIFGVLLATGVISFKSLFSSEVVLPDGYERVPYVLNMNKDEAIARIEAAGFNYEYGATVISEYLTKDSVVAQTPESGGIYPKNSIISLVICEGDGSDPALLYKPQDDVVELFEENGISYEIQTEYSNTEAGLTCRIVLDDGSEVFNLSEIPEGSHVIVYLSLGLQPVIVPDCYNMTVEDAASLLYEMGLVPDEANYIYAVSEDVEPGHIISQSIPAGDEVSLGTSVYFTIAIEEEIELFEVPSVVGLRSNSAQSNLRDAGFNVSVYSEPSSTVPEGNVIRQNPSGGSMRESGTSVTIYISSGAPVAPPADEFVPETMPANENATESYSESVVESSESSESAAAASTTSASTVTVTTTTTTSSTSSSTSSTTTTEALRIGSMEDVEIHRENGVYSATVIADYSESAESVSWTTSNSDILTVTPTSDGSATLTSIGRGTVTVTVTVSRGTETESQSFTVRCYDNVAVYSDWGARQYSISPIAESDTRMALGEEDVVISTQWYVQMDYYLYMHGTGESAYRQYYPTAQSGRSLVWHWASDGSYLVAPSNDGGISPAGWSTCIGNNRTSGDYRGYNGTYGSSYSGSSQVGYVDSSGRIFFVVGSYSESQSEHRYYYCDRTVSYVVSCD